MKQIKATYLQYMHPWAQEDWGGNDLLGYEK